MPLIIIISKLIAQEWKFYTHKLIQQETKNTLLRKRHFIYFIHFTKTVQVSLGLPFCLLSPDLHASRKRYFAHQKTCIKTRFFFVIKYFNLKINFIDRP